MMKCLKSLVLSEGIRVLICCRRGCEDLAHVHNKAMIYAKEIGVFKVSSSCGSRVDG